MIDKMVLICLLRLFNHHFLLFCKLFTSVIAKPELNLISQVFIHWTQGVNKTNIKYVLSKPYSNTPCHYIFSQIFTAGGANSKLDPSMEAWLALVMMNFS